MLPTGVVNTSIYNGEGRRVEKQDSAGVTKFVWDFENYLLELDAANATKVLYTQSPDTYGQLIAQRRGPTAATPTLYFLFDGLGSTVATGTSIFAVERFRYRAFGETTQYSGNPSATPFRWVGQLGYYYDLDLLEYYLRARQYSPALARFLSIDPLGFDAGQSHVYVYGDNSPINAIDPTGLRCVLCNSHVSYRDSVATLDAFVKTGGIYQLLTGRAHTRVQTTYPNINLPKPTAAGPTVVSKGNTDKVAFFLLFVSFLVCEDAPGDCQLWQDETGTTIRAGNSPPQQVPSGIENVTERFIVLSDSPTPKANAKAGCNKIYVYVDAPRIATKRGITGKWAFRELKVVQKIILTDSTQGKTVGSVNHGLTIAFDDTGQFHTNR